MKSGSCPWTELNQSVKSATRTSAALVSIVPAATICGANGERCRAPWSDLAKSHVENGAVNGESTRTISHEAQSFEIMRQNGIRKSKTDAN